MSCGFCALSVTIASNPIISRFMKGIFKINPPTPRYKTTWDPHIVLNYLSSLGTGDKLTLKLLSMKLLMLTSLVSAQRGQSLHMLDIRFMKEYLRRTKPLRGDSTKLLISFMKPHKHMSKELCPAGLKLWWKQLEYILVFSIPTAQGQLPHQKQKKHVYPFSKSWTLHAGHHQKHLTDFITSLHLMNLRLLTHF